jgi:hypothetical protein
MMSVKSKNIHVLPTDKQCQNIYITSDEEIKVGDYVIYLKKNEVFLSKGKIYRNSLIKKIILTTDQDLIDDGVQTIDDEFLEWFVKNPSCEEVEINQEKVLWRDGRITHHTYKITIPKEEPKQECECTDECLGYLTKECKGIEQPKQETLEEVAYNYASKKLQRPITIYTPLESNVAEYCAFIEGAKWQQEQDKKMYSEEEMINFIANELVIEKKEFIVKKKLKNK